MHSGPATRGSLDHWSELESGGGGHHRRSRTVAMMSSVSCPAVDAGRTKVAWPSWRWMTLSGTAACEASRSRLRSGSPRGLPRRRRPGGRLDSQKLDGTESHEFEPDDVDFAAGASDADKGYCADAVSIDGGSHALAAPARRTECLGRTAGRDFAWVPERERLRRDFGSIARASAGAHLAKTAWVVHAHYGVL